MRRRPSASLRHVWLQLRPIAAALPLVLLWCEWLIYHWTLSACEWPRAGGGRPVLRAMLIADTHLLGPFRGHWFDRLRREWQMHRGFVTARSYLDPDIHFILGDLFDEGQWCSFDQLADYKSRLHSLFPVPEDKPIYTVVGNHDIGFHYAMHPSRVHWFEQHFAAEPVRMLRAAGVFFVMVNSMAMEGDRCRLCDRAERQLARLNATLRCLERGESNCDGYTGAYSRPIVLQHFPLYRRSDAHCTGADRAPDAAHKVFRERWECLSKASTRHLLDTMQPRAVFGGHTHAGCVTDCGALVGNGACTEWTVGSFSWRNTPTPSLLLLSVSGERMSVSKCYLPSEPNVLLIYGVYAACSALYLTVCLVAALLTRSNVAHKLY